MSFEGKNSEDSLKRGRRDFSHFIQLLSQKNESEKPLLYKRIIVKVGSGVIAKNGGVDENMMRHLVEEISSLRERGLEVLLVSSGAIAVGREDHTTWLKSLGLEKSSDKETTVEEQSFASTGQPILIAKYIDIFKSQGHKCGQVLLTRKEFSDKESYRTVKNLMEHQLANGITPIINENDSVCTDEIRYTDNDQLAGDVAAQMNVDAVIVLTSVPGVLTHNGDVISKITAENFSEAKTHIRQEKTATGRGGMHSKFNLAARLMEEGRALHMANGKQRGVISAIAEGTKIGTEFVPSRQH